MSDNDRLKTTERPHPGLRLGRPPDPRPEGESQVVITPEAAQAILEAERQRRADRCWLEIQNVLQHHSCEITAVPQFTPDGRVGVQIIIQPRDRGPGPPPMDPNGR